MSVSAIPPRTAAVMSCLCTQYKGVRHAAKTVADVVNRSTRTVENWFAFRNALSLEDAMHLMAENEAVRAELLHQVDLIKQQRTQNASHRSPIARGHAA